MDALQRYLSVVSRVIEKVRDKRDTLLPILYIILILIATFLFGSIVYLYSQSSGGTATAEVRNPYTQLNANSVATAESIPSTEDPSTSKDQEKADLDTSAACKNACTASEPKPADSSLESSSRSSGAGTLQNTAESLLSGETTKQVTDSVQDGDSCGGLLSLNKTTPKNCLDDLATSFSL